MVNLSKFNFFSKRKFASSLMGVGVLIAGLTIGSPDAFAKDVKINKWEEYKDTSTKNIIEDNIKSVQPGSSKETYLWLHNNGEPIDTNIISGDTDFYLEAISKDVVNGQEVIDYYFNQVENEERTLDDIKETVLERKAENKNELSVKMGSSEKTNLKNDNTVSIAAVQPVANPVIRNFNWSFNSSAHYLTTSVEMSRKSSTASINGVAGSVWDVVTNTQYERTSGLRYLNDLYTRLAVPYTYQTLLDWGPSTTSSSTVAVSLSGAGVPGISYSFNTGVRYNTVDLSSKSSKYGRWNFTRALYPIYSNKLTARPAIRSSNTSGNFALELSHSLEFDNVTNNTGVITITTPDR